MLRSFAVVGGFLAAALTVQAQRVCNNSPDLCDRNYNNITHLGAHDSPFLRNAETGFSLFGNQYYPSTTQLDAGVRLLTGQVHRNNTSWDLCHSDCAFLDTGPLTTWLTELKAWLDNNPNEVVTILLVNADNADAETLDQQFQAANIVDYAYTPPDTTTATSDWPTLNEMIDQNRRLVVWIANLAPDTNTVAPYLLDQFTFVFENDYSNDAPTEFSCEPDRPTNLQTQDIQSVLSSGYIPLMNHFLYNNINGIQIPAEDQANNTNADSGDIGNLGDAANNCTSFYGRAPTYILVDFFNVARSITTVDRLNGVTGQTSGRIELPDTVEESRATTTSSSSTASPTTSDGSFVSSSATSSTTSGDATSTTSPGNGGGKLCKKSKSNSRWAAGGAAAIVAML